MNKSLKFGDLTMNDISSFLVYEDDYIKLYNCDCRLFATQDIRVDLVFADPPFGIDLSSFQNVIFEKCDGHVFLMTNEREIIKTAFKNIKNFSRMYAVDTVMPCMISAKAPMQLADFVAEFRYSNTKFVNNNDSFSNLIRAKKMRIVKNYSQNFDKNNYLFATFFKHFTKEGDTILDPFCGSGNSIFVAKRLKRKIIAFEENAESVSYILQKLKQLDLFDNE